MVTRTNSRIPKPPGAPGVTKPTSQARVFMAKMSGRLVRSSSGSMEYKANKMVRQLAAKERA